jgi:hypothetical protein
MRVPRTPIVARVPKFIKPSSPRTDNSKIMINIINLSLQKASI